MWTDETGSVARSRVRERRVIPEAPYDHESMQRFYHQDLEDLETEDLEAERVMLATEQARLVFHRVRPRLLMGAETSDRAWITERLTRIRRELCLRKKGAHA